MASGREISVAFIREAVWPVLEAYLGGEAKRVAIAVIGTGSDVSGLDDEISRDHHWGPRANVMFLPGDETTLLPRARDILTTHLPREFRGFTVAQGLVIMTGVCCTGIDDFFRYFLGTAELPGGDPDWLKLCETDLLHVTGGEVVIDGPGELTRRRAFLRYYPDAVWRKRIADWCMYITGRDAPYNLHRLAKRGDNFTSAIYKGQYAKQAMELCFTLNRQYAPYTKWLRRLVETLPPPGPEIARRLDELMAEPDLRRNVTQMIEVNYVLADAIAKAGLTAAVHRVPFDDHLTDLTLYNSAAQIYGTIPPALFAPSFNRVELWERLARDVLFDTNDYFRRRPEAAS